MYAVRNKSAAAFSWPIHRLTRHDLRNAVLITLLALAPAILVVAAANRHGPQEDGGWYMDVAQSLAAGRGFQQLHGYWPGKPITYRPPLWPFIESLVIRSFPSVHPLSAAHLAGLGMHAVTILGVVALVWMLTGRLVTVSGAAAIVGLWPGAIASIVAGESEPCVGAVIAVGTALMVAGGRWLWAGVLVLSLLPLGRSNFLILPVWIAVAFAMLRYPPTAISDRRRILLAAILFYIPAACWTLRNYVATGAFPILAGNSGAALYGDWNSASAAIGPAFAMWIPPSEVPGEKPKARLAKSMTELEVDRYYRRRAFTFIENHLPLVPVVFAGHLVRAFLPQRSAAPSMRRRYRLPEWIWRLSLYAAAMVLWMRKPPEASIFRLLLCASALTVITTVILFHGEQRFMYPLTVLLAAYVCSQWPRARSI
jgi:hypothetical protein